LNPVTPGNLPLTGERTLPDIPEENYWFRRHEVGYRSALPIVAGKRVLDLGCGEGYGAALLATAAAEVIGLDYDARTVADASGRYRQARFIRANIAAPPFPDRSVDVIATLQVIEHVWNRRQFLGECLRVLRPGGLLLVTTPNRLTFSAGLKAPVNPFHTKEFTAAELADLITENGFTVDKMSGLHAGSRLDELDDLHGGSFVHAQLTTPSEQWSEQLRADVATISADDFRILPTETEDVDRSLDLVVIASRPLR
jgi:SAM-dependent methyltransferase